MKTGVVIFARSKSERFPGKVLAPIAGRPMLSWLIDKGKKVNPDVVVVSTSTEPEDDAIANLCEQEGCEVWRGPNRDILSRMLGCWGHFGLTHAVEFSGDCPFIDVRPAFRIMDTFYQQSGFDSYDPTFYPSGVLGIMCSGKSRGYWEKLANLVAEQPQADRVLYQEWPWGLIHRAPARFSSLPIKTSDLFAPDKTPISLCVDYPLQLWFLDKFARKLGGVPDTYEPVEEGFRKWQEV